MYNLVKTIRIVKFRKPLLCPLCELAIVDFFGWTSDRAQSY